ncbi:hypothetical protein L228DRAFT_13019 [Xylona heveae TC161]|uniref:Uncharacterized protein n=1 Tax=Xylona heveae (strain CBS 132557 / TC161) TaxID=1328760 RepID=A0A165JNY8_XYLHT|nr:hypothetical protein L228DRAFT_13019 [Xylona heveae TC161]KZF26466.1 hypothetical protein L228DRAFT_13019 [Xylona heveae TC161]
MKMIVDYSSQTCSFRPGPSMSSFGTSCAAMNGIDMAVIERAEEFIRLAARGDDLVLACTGLTEQEELEVEAADEIARMFLELDLPDPATEECQTVRVMLESIVTGS